MRYGLLQKPIDPPEYIMGANSPIRKTKINESGDWKDYLPVIEPQKYKGLETMSCVSFSYNNAIEILFKFYYGRENNYSDRFLAKVSDTTKRGNYLGKVAETARKKGVCREEVWPYPYEGATYTWDDYYKQVSNESLFEAWKIHDKIQHEWVDAPDWREALKYSPLQVTVNAWYKNDEGLYYNPNTSQNHAVVLIGYEGYNPIIFDTYEPFIKKLTADHAMGRYAKSFTIKEPLNMEFKDKVIYKAAINGSMKIGFYLDGRLVVNQDEAEKFNVFFEGLSRGADPMGIVTISSEDFNSIEHINLKGEKI